MLMKTDCDTFLTPAFARWLPDGFHTGHGGYAGSLLCLISFSRASDVYTRHTLTHTRTYRHV
jgi:hypothetical protein